MYNNYYLFVVVSFFAFAKRFERHSKWRTGLSKKREPFVGHLQLHHLRETMNE